MLCFCEAKAMTYYQGCRVLTSCHNPVWSISSPVPINKMCHAKFNVTTLTLHQEKSCASPEANEVNILSNMIQLSIASLEFNEDL